MTTLVRAPLSTLLDRWRPDHLPRSPARLVVPAAARAITIGGIARRTTGPLLVVVPSERDAEALAADLRLFVDDVLLFPSWETLPVRTCVAQHGDDGPPGRGPPPEWPRHPTACWW